MELYGFPSAIVFNLLAKNAVNPVDASGINININTPYTYVSPEFILNPFINDANIMPYNNPYIPNNGTAATLNTNFPNWLTDTNNYLDLRGFYLGKCTTFDQSQCVNMYYQIFTWPTTYLTTISSITKQQIAFTT